MEERRTQTAPLSPGLQLRKKLWLKGWGAGGKGYKDVPLWIREVGAGGDGEEAWDAQGVSRRLNGGGPL